MPDIIRSPDQFILQSPTDLDADSVRHSLTYEALPKGKGRARVSVRIALVRQARKLLLQFDTLAISRRNRGRLWFELAPECARIVTRELLLPGSRLSYLATWSWLR